MELDFNFEQVSLADTDIEPIDFDAVLLPLAKYGIATLEYVSGTAIQADGAGVNAITSATASITSANPKAIITIQRGVPLNVKGGADSIFTVSIISDYWGFR